jgi:antitoxin (DNA-binding transcriptional repressor) of toxin-antitoxin stability system
MTTMTLKQLEHDVPAALHRVTAGHDVVVLEKEGHAVAVIIPAEQYFQSKDDDIPASFWQGLKESRAGLGVDMETALHETPPGA